MIKKYLIVFLFLCLLIIPIIDAVTLTGTLGGYNVTSDNYVVEYGAGAYPHPHYLFGVDNIEYFFGTDVLVHFDTDSALPSSVSIYDSGAPNSIANVPFTLHLDTVGGMIIGTGTFGYQRAFSTVSPYPEVGGYQWYYFNDFSNTSGLTGDHLIYVVNTTSMYASYILTDTSVDYRTLGNGRVCLQSSTHCGSGSYIRNSILNTEAQYTVTSPIGLGIEGTITKISEISVGVVYNGGTGGVLASETSFSASPFNFTMPNPSGGIIVGILGGDGLLRNSSVLFSGGFPSGTPTPTPYPTSTTTYSGTQPIDLTIYIRDSNGNTPINNAFVELHRNDIYDSINSGYTNASGAITFYGSTVTSASEVRAWANGYNYGSMYLPFSPTINSIFTIYLNQVGISPTPTPVPSYDTWSLQAQPNSILLGESFLLLASCSNATKETATGGLNVVLYYENNNLGAYSQNNLVGVYRYNSSMAAWDFRHNNTDTWNYASAASPLDLTVIPLTTGLYTYQVATFGIGSVSWGIASTQINIGGGGVSGALVMNLFAYDGSTTSHLSNYELILTDDITGTSHTYNVVYDIDVSLLRGNSYTLEGSKTGYETNSVSFVVPVNQNIQMGDFGAMQGVALFPSGTISVGNTTVSVHVDDIETYFPIPNVQIVMSGILAPKFTGTSGEAVSFILPHNTLYTVTASKQGYCSVSETQNTSTLNYYYMDLYMKFGSCVGVTPTHTPIPNATAIISTPTMVGGYGQLNGTATVCNRSFTEISLAGFKNLLACNGITDLLSQNLAMAMCIMLFAGLILGKVAKGIGVLAGVVAGAVISMAAGLLPFWIIIVLIILAGLIFAVKIFWSGE
jgi:hypothetical protein